MRLRLTVAVWMWPTLALAASSVHVVTDPDGAVVWGEGYLRLGTTTADGLTIPGLGPGPVTLYVRKPGFVTVQKTIEVPETGPPVEVVIHLQASLSVTRAPDAASTPPVAAAPRVEDKEIPQAQQVEQKKSRGKLPIVILGVVGAGVGVAALAHGGTDSSTASSLTTTPTTTPPSIFSQFYGTYPSVNFVLTSGPFGPLGCESYVYSTTLSGNPDGSSFKIQFSNGQFTKYGTAPWAGSVQTDGQFTASDGFYRITGQTTGRRLTGSLVSLPGGLPDRCTWSVDGAR